MALLIPQLCLPSSKSGLSPGILAQATKNPFLRKPPFGPQLCLPSSKSGFSPGILAQAVKNTFLREKPLFAPIGPTEFHSPFSNTSLRQESSPRHLEIPIYQKRPPFGSKYQTQKVSTPHTSHLNNHTLLPTLVDVSTSPIYHYNIILHLKKIRERDTHTMCVPLSPQSMHPGPT